VTTTSRSFIFEINLERLSADNMVPFERGKDDKVFSWIARHTVKTY
jgi:hypothetical protein